MLAANDSSCTASPARASTIAAATVSGGLHDALAHQVLSDVDPALVDPDDLALLDLEHDLVTDLVDERDAAVDQDLRPEVRVAPAGARDGVDDRDRLAGDQRLRGHLVDVQVLDDGDVAVLQPLGEVLGAGVHPGDAGEPRRQWLAGLSAQERHSHRAHPSTQPRGRPSG